MSINNFKNSPHQGFTLIETFVAITILMITILGPMSLISKFYADSTYAKNQISASFLAQDGMETVQNIIKNNSAQRRQMLTSSTYDDAENEVFTTCKDLVDNEDWLEGFTDKEAGSNVTSIDNSVVACTELNGCSLEKNSGGYYIASSTDNSIFTRKIVITRDVEEVATFGASGTVVAGDESKLRRSAQVTVSVWWTEKGNVRGPAVISSLIIQNQCP